MRISDLREVAACCAYWSLDGAAFVSNAKWLPGQKIYIVCGFRKHKFVLIVQLRFWFKYGVIHEVNRGSLLHISVM